VVSARRFERVTGKPDQCDRPERHSGNGVHDLFQMTFAIITPALIVGAFAERMKFSALLLFMGVWFTVVYLPVAHMVWGGNGSLMWQQLGRAGFCRRHGGAYQCRYCRAGGLSGAWQAQGAIRTTAMPPHNLNFTIMGASMLWVGWFGFNAGSAVAANANAGMAMAVTQIATAMAALAGCLRNG
jgi:Amt family ammonium transporter